MHTINSDDLIMFFGFAVNGFYSGSAFLTVYNWYTDEINTDKIILMPWEMSDLQLDPLGSMKFQRNHTFSKNGLVISYNDNNTMKNHITRIYKIKSKKLKIDSEFQITLKKNVKSKVDALQKLPKDEGYLLAQKIDEEGKFWSLGYKQYGMRVDGYIDFKSKEQEKVDFSRDNDA